MKVIIFAGGWGTRLGQLSEVIPKPMVLIGSRPILWHIMNYYSCWGLNDFIILLGVKGHVIKQYFYNFDALNNDFTVDLKKGEVTYHSDHYQKEWRVTLVNTGINNAKGSRLAQVEKYLDDDINMMTYGDGLSDIDLNALITFHKSHGKILTISGVHPTSRFGELTDMDGYIQNFYEKPQSARAYINGGFSIFDKRIFELLSMDPESDLENGAYQALAERQEMMVFKHEGYWECMDHERDVQHLNNLWNSGNAFWKIW